LVLTPAFTNPVKPCKNSYRKFDLLYRPEDDTAGRPEMLAEIKDFTGYHRDHNYARRIESAVEAIKKGAYHYLRNPLIIYLQIFAQKPGNITS
jgi:hypothetical protein